MPGVIGALRQPRPPMLRHCPAAFPRRLLLRAALGRRSPCKCTLSPILEISFLPREEPTHRPSRPPATSMPTLYSVEIARGWRAILGESPLPWDRQPLRIPERDPDESPARSASARPPTATLPSSPERVVTFSPPSGEVPPDP